MPASDRRTFLGQLAAVATAIPGLGSLSARAAGPELAPSLQTGSGATYDLLVAGGHVVDPSQQMSGVADVAVQGGRVARIAPGIPRSQARQVYDAAGRIVTPGLIDIHSHVYKYGIPLSTDPDRVGILSGVTTIVDCGSTGANTFMAFRNYIIERAANRIYALLNISTIGLAVSNEIYLDPQMIDPKAALRVIEANRDIILGVKVRVRGRRVDLAHDVNVLKTAREVADAAGIPIMLHWTNEPDLLAILKRGDILTHPFNPPSVNFANLFGSDGRQEDKVLPQILELKARGVWIDGQAATTHHEWAISEKAVGQGWWPDSISTDLAQAAPTPPGSVPRPGFVGYRAEAVGVPVPMSHFLHLGLSLEQVIERVTATPARMLGFPEKVGTLEAGAPADISIFDLAEGTFEFRDGAGAPRVARRQFVPVATVKAGIFVMKADVG